MKGESISLEGRHYRLRDATLRIQPRRAPILIAAGGERMLDLAAQYADAWNPAGGGGEQGFKTRLGQLQAAMRTHGRDPSEIRRLYNLSGRFDGRDSHGDRPHL